MSIDTTLRINSTSLAATENLAAEVGTRTRGGEVIALSSDLGGGKTAFVRGLARGMGSENHVASPTFTLGRVYETKNKKLTLFHFDFYRLNDPGIMAFELAEVLTDPGAVVAIEWGAVMDDILPTDTVAVTIERTGEESRDISFTYPERLAYLFEDVS